MTVSNRLPIKLAALIALSALLLASAVLLPGTASSANTSLTSIERELPEFSLKGMDGEPWTPRQLDGKPWVINFWATWCPPCIEEMPSMNEAWKALEPEGVGMLAINVGESRPDIAVFLEKVAVDFPIALGDSSGTLPNWSVRGLPTTVVVNADGKVVYEAIGPRDWDDPEIIKQVLSLK